MNYRKISSTDITISEIGLGCWALGGLNWEKGTIPSGWSPVESQEVTKAVQYALDQGVTHFDNADCYGNGEAERLLAQSLGSHNNSVIISSKVGWITKDDHHYSQKNILRQCELSLKNLNRETIDIYYFHHGDFGKNDQYLSEAMETMIKLQEQGKIRAIGLSTYSQKQFKRLIPQIKPDVVQCWAHMMDYHFIAKNSTLQVLSEQYNSTIIGFQPLNQGILLDKYSSESPPQFQDGDHRINLDKFSSESLRQIKPKLDILKEKYGRTPEELAAVAFRFVLNHQRVGGTIVGFRNKKQVRQNLTCSMKLNGSDMSFIYNLFRK